MIYQENGDFPTRFIETTMALWTSRSQPGSLTRPVETRTPPDVLGRPSCHKFDCHWPLVQWSLQRRIYIWVNYNDLTDLPHWNPVSKGNHPQMAARFSEILFHLPRYMGVETQ